VATKKQRRRREKQRRHEWEYVKVTDEGEEVVADSPREAASSSKSGSSSSSSKSAPVDARGRPLQKPSFQRLGKRAAIFGPLLVVLVFITGGDDVSTGAKIFQAVLLLLIFLPLSYLLDTVMYRTLSRRHERKQAARSGRG
jgi:hypothetical protein